MSVKSARKLHMGMMTNHMPALGDVVYSRYWNLGYTVTAVSVDGAVESTWDDGRVTVHRTPLSIGDTRNGVLIADLGY